MGEPARKLDHGSPRSHPPRQGRRAQVLPLRRRAGAQRSEDTWVLDQIVRWYQTRRD